MTAIIFNLRKGSRDDSTSGLKHRVLVLANYLGEDLI